ncbi:MAG TPA: alpha/beta hydrolase [Gaiellaceae bacterium]|nr:alpha/beta hydrolase [Gaiellaceae bacterium]
MQRDELDRALAEAQEALLARQAPGTRVRRVGWSGGETQVLELGAGPPLLLVHGGGDCAIEWVPVLSQLARTHHVLAVDRPGHGLADPFDYSGVDLLEHARVFLGDVLDALGLEATEIAGNSMGGLWSVAFALASPDRVSRLALLGAPPGLRRSVPRQLRLLGLPLLGGLVGRRLLADQTPEASRAFWGELLVARPERLDNPFLEADAAHMRRNVDSVLSLIGRAAGARGLSRALLLGERWQELAVPTLLLYGDRDAFVGRRDEAAWSALLERNPHLRVVRVAGAGHLPWLDAPERVVGELEGFLTTDADDYRRRRTA